MKKMSGNGYTTTCPECGEEMSAYSDHKPHDYVSAECLECGFCYYTTDAQMTLKEVNDLRVEQGMTKLKKLKSREAKK